MNFVQNNTYLKLLLLVSIYREKKMYFIENQKFNKKHRIFCVIFIRTFVIFCVSKIKKNSFKITIIC